MLPTHVRTEVIVSALQLACRAPSLHNSQPWRWIVDEHHIDLFADPARVVRGTDGTGREALISCGAVLDHFRVAMAATGWEVHVQRLPEPAEPWHVARVTVAAATPASSQQRRRAAAILLRRTDRLPLDHPPDWAGLSEVLDAAARTAATRLEVLADEHREILAEASHLVDAIRAYDSAYRDDIDWWTGEFASAVGIPGSARVSAAESDRVGVARAFPVTTHAERRPEVAQDRARIVVLCTENDSAQAVLRCGEALSAILLDVAMAGMSSCTVTHLTEVPEGREFIATLLDGTSIPQVLVRIGMAPAVDHCAPPTPRRALDEVVEIRRAT